MSVVYRVYDEIRVKRANGVFWTLTFTPVLPHSGATVGPPRHRVVTVTEACHERLKDHGPNYAEEEIDRMGAPRANPNPAMKWLKRRETRG